MRIRWSAAAMMRVGVLLPMTLVAVGCRPPEPVAPSSEETAGAAQSEVLAIEVPAGLPDLPGAATPSRLSDRPHRQVAHRLRCKPETGLRLLAKLCH